MSNRKDYNDKILANLKAYLDAYPDQRFGQALVNLGILIRSGSAYDGAYFHHDVIHVESKDIYNQMKLVSDFETD